MKNVDLTTLKLKFAFQVHDPTDSRGITFHRWLPDGEKDALICPTGTPRARMKIWFEQRGFQKHGPDSFIEYDPNRREVDPVVMEQQGSLEGGHLWGLLEVDDLTDAEQVAVRSEITDSAAYESLAKRLVKSWLHPQLSRVINILRANYGQYWLEQLKPFDSRKGSIGAYYAAWQVHSTLDDGQTWTRFRPNIVFNVGSFGGRGRDYLEYLTEKDWKDLQAAVTDGYEPSLAAQLLSNAHGHLDKGNVELSLVEGVTSLETALQEFVDRWGGSADAPDMSTALRKLSLAKGFEIIAAVSRKLSPPEVRNVVQAIKLRNDVVHHRAKLPTKERMIPVAQALLKAVAAFLEGPRFKFPSEYIGHSRMGSGNWEKLSEPP